MTVEYLLELRFSEVPPRLLKRAVRGLSMRLFEDLMGRGLGPREMITGITPRRLMVCLQGLPGVEPDREVRELGPPVEEAYEDSGEPTAALSGFLERVGAEPEDLQQVKTERGVYLAVLRDVPGKLVRDVLAEIVPVVIGELEWWLPMRAGSGLHGLLSLLDGEILDLELSGVSAGASTAGHPVLSPEPFEVADCADYLRRLRELGIEVIPEARRAALEEALTRRAADLGGELVGEDGLLDRLSSACEIPGVVDGSFDADYTTLPEEVLLAVLGGRLDAFALRGKVASAPIRGDEALLPVFLTVMDRADDPQGLIQAGQERTAAGRLVDARFRYQADRKLTLAERSRRLDGLDFHPRLGSQAAKAERIRELVELACGELGWRDVLEPAREASALLKADLTSGMVRDYPSLRGTIGGIYAREEGYIEVVWRAIYEQYRGGTSRRGASGTNYGGEGGSIPRDRVGWVVALADRLDSLVGFFGIGQTPSGSKDPFGLRRLARGLLGIVVDGEMELDLDLVTARAVLLYGDVLDRGAEDLLHELQTFIGDRFRHFLGQRGFAYDEIEAAEAIGTKNLPDLLARITALKAVREEGDFRSLVLAAKRIFNIVRDSPEYELRPDELADGAEQGLYVALGPVREAVDRAAAERRYEDCLRSMADLVPHLDHFFADVLVMDEDESLRANRIALLQACRRVFWRIARLKAMAVEKSDPV